VLLAVRFEGLTWVGQVCRTWVRLALGWGCVMVTSVVQRGQAGAPPRARWAIAVVVGSLLAGACTSGSEPGSSAASGTSSQVGGSTSSQAHDRIRGSAGLMEPLLPTAGSSAEREVDDAVAVELEQLLGSPSFRTLRSILVLADGRQVLERYYQSEPTDHHHVWSITKSVISTLVGIAIGRGELQGVDQDLAGLLPAYASTMPPAVAGTTLEQILTMTGGFGRDDPGARVSPVTDWVAEILAESSSSSESSSASGGAFRYSNAGVHVLSAILVQATGMSTLDYARQVLFDPLGISSTPAREPVADGEDWQSFDAAFEAPGFAWAVDPQGVHTGGWGLRLRAQDLARIGLMYLNDGRWQGQQVVPEEWIREATRAHVEASGERQTGEYGYLWWVTTADGAPAFAAIGSGGQILEVVPSRGLVVVLQSESDGRGGPTARMLHIVDSLIAPSFRS